MRSFLFPLSAADGGFDEDEAVAGERVGEGEVLTTSGRRKRQRVALMVRVARCGSVLESGRSGRGVEAGEGGVAVVRSGVGVGVGMVRVMHLREEREVRGGSARVYRGEVRVSESKKPADKKGQQTDQELRDIALVVQSAQHAELKHV